MPVIAHGFLIAVVWARDCASLRLGRRVRHDSCGACVFGAGLVYIYIWLLQWKTEGTHRAHPQSQREEGKTVCILDIRYYGCQSLAH